MASMSPAMAVWPFLLLVLILVRTYIACLPRKPPRPRHARTCSLAVFLGSGGHTSEAISLLSSLDFTRYTPRTYFVSKGDSLSIQKAIALESIKSPNLSSQPEDSRTCTAHYRIVTIPRARHVHQKLLTTPWTASYSLIASIYHLALYPFLLASASRPFVAEVLILNGPGTCFVLCIAAYFNRILGLPSPQLIYIESFARVRSLSLSGKLLRSIVDIFVVQWPDLLDDKRKGIYHGWLV